MSNRFTALEQNLLHLFHLRLEQYGFPPVDELEFLSREHTGVGRYTHLTHGGRIDIADAHMDHDYMIELDKLEVGADVWCSIANNKLQYLEILVIGDDHWDGSESGWRLLNKETGEPFKAPDRP